eukprot:TRINITY_DN5675_c1_g1_i1.p1 TRINITY_DN5675_c1_g1~~TRINITY_DN5675_c1_g1_i1.p1  ORF type:complete len:3175 (+),score=1078.04 TRINITY_DN5675_c1_g1_i1:73-9597(+)
MASGDEDASVRADGIVLRLTEELEAAKLDRERVTALLFEAMRFARQEKQLPASPELADDTSAAELMRVLGLEDVLRRQKAACTAAKELLVESSNEIARLRAQVTSLQAENALLRASGGTGMPAAPPPPPPPPPPAPLPGHFGDSPVLTRIESVQTMRSVNSGGSGGRLTKRIAERRGVTPPLVNLKQPTGAFEQLKEQLRAHSPLGKDTAAKDGGESGEISPRPSILRSVSQMTPRNSIAKRVSLVAPALTSSPNASKDRDRDGFKTGAVPSPEQPEKKDDRHEDTPPLPAALPSMSRLPIRPSVASALTVLPLRPSVAGMQTAPSSRSLLERSRRTEMQEDHVFHYLRRLPPQQNMHWFGRRKSSIANRAGNAAASWIRAMRSVPEDFSMYALVRTAREQKNQISECESPDAGFRKDVLKDALKILDERPFFFRKRTVVTLLFLSIIIEVVDSALDIRTCAIYGQGGHYLAAVLMAAVLVVCGVLRGMLNYHIARRNDVKRESFCEWPTSKKMYILVSFFPIPISDVVEGCLAFSLVAGLEPVSFLVLEPVRNGRQQLRACFRAFCESAPQLLLQAYMYFTVLSEETQGAENAILQMSMVVSGISILKAILMYVRAATGAQGRGALLDEYNLTDPVQKRALYEPSPLQLLQRMDPAQFTDFFTQMAHAEFGYVRIDDLMLLLKSAGCLLRRMQGGPTGCFAGKKDRLSTLAWPRSKALLMLNCLVDLSSVFIRALATAGMHANLDDDDTLSLILACTLSAEMLEKPLLVGGRFDAGLPMFDVLRSGLPTLCQNKRARMMSHDRQGANGMVFAGGVAGGQPIRGDGALVLASMLAGQPELRWLDASGNRLAEPVHLKHTPTVPGGHHADWIWKVQGSDDLASRGMTDMSSFEPDGAAGIDLVFAAILASSARHDGAKLSHVDLRANCLHNQHLWTAARLTLAMCSRSLPPLDSCPSGTPDTLRYLELRQALVMQHGRSNIPLRPIHILVRGGNGTPEVAGVDLDRIDVVVQAVIDMLHEDFGTDLVPPDPSGDAAAVTAEGDWVVPGPCTMDGQDLAALSAILRDFARLRALMPESRRRVSAIHFHGKVGVKPDVWREEKAVHAFGLLFECQCMGLRVKWSQARRKGTNSDTMAVSALLSAVHAVADDRVGTRTVFFPEGTVGCVWENGAGGVVLTALTDGSPAAGASGAEECVGKRVVCVDGDVRCPAVRSVEDMPAPTHAPSVLFFCDSSTSPRKLSQSLRSPLRRIQSSCPGRKSQLLSGLFGDTAAVSERVVTPPDADVCLFILRFCLVVWQYGRHVLLRLPSGTSTELQRFVEESRTGLLEGRKVPFFSLQGESVPAHDLQYAVECARALRRSQLTVPEAAGRQDKLCRRASADFQFPFGERQHSQDTEVGHEFTHQPTSDIVSVHSQGACDETGLESITLSDCVLDDAHVAVLRELLQYVAIGCCVMLRRTTILPRHLQELMEHQRVQAKFSMYLTSNEKLNARAAVTSRVLLQLRCRFADVDFHWGDWDKREIAGHTVPYRVAEGLRKPRPSASCQTVGDYARPALHSDCDKPASAREVISGMRKWQYGDGHFPFKERAVMGLLSDSELVAKCHAKGLGDDAVMPLFAYTAELHHDALWAVWEWDWTLSRGTEGCGRSGHWRLLNPSIAKELEKSFSTNGELLRVGDSLDLSSSRASLRARQELGGTDPLLRFELPAVGLWGFAAGSSFDSGGLTLIVRYANTCGGDAVKSPFCDTVLWLPSPGDPNKFGVGWEWAPPPGMLEYISSRPRREIVEGSGWCCQAHDALQPVISERQSALWKEGLSEAVLASDLPFIDQMRGNTQVLHWGERVFLLAFERSHGFVGELDPTADPPVWVHRVERLFRVTDPLPVQPCGVVNSALRILQYEQQSTAPVCQQRAGSMSPRARTRGLSRWQLLKAHHSPALNSTADCGFEASPAGQHSESWRNSNDAHTVEGRTEPLTAAEGRLLIDSVRAFVHLLDRALASVPAKCHPSAGLWRRLPRSNEVVDRLYVQGQLVLWAGFSTAAEGSGWIAGCRDAAARNFRLRRPQGSKFSGQTTARPVWQWSRRARDLEWMYPANTLMEVDSEALATRGTMSLVSVLDAVDEEEPGPPALSLTEVSETDVHCFLVRGLLPQARTTAAAGVIFEVQKALRGDRVLQLSLEDQNAGRADPRWEMLIGDQFQPAECPVPPTVQWVPVRDEDAARQLGRIHARMPPCSDKDSEMAQRRFSAVAESTGWAENFLAPPWSRDSNADVLALACRLLGIPHDAQGTARPNVLWLHAPQPGKQVQKFLHMRVARWSIWGLELQLRKGRGREGLAIGGPGARILAAVLRLGVPLRQLGLVNNAIDGEQDGLLEAVRSNPHVVEVMLDDSVPKPVRSALALRCLHNRQSQNGSPELQLAQLLGVGDEWPEAAATALCDLPVVRLPLYDMVLHYGKESRDGVPVWQQKWRELRDAFHDRGADPPRCTTGCLHTIAREGEVWALRALLSMDELQLELDTPGVSGLTPLHIACRNEREEVLELICAACPDALRTTASDGSTALHLACQAGANTVYKLLEKGADVSTRDFQGETALHRVVTRPELDDGSLKAAALFVRLSEGGLLDARDNHGRTPLHIAAAHGRAEICKALLDAGADPDAEDSQNATPLLCALQHCKPRTVKVLHARSSRQLPKRLVVLGAAKPLQHEPCSPVSPMRRRLTSPALPPQHEWTPLQDPFMSRRAAGLMGRYSAEFQCTLESGDEVLLQTWPLTGETAADAEAYGNDLRSKLLDELTGTYGSVHPDGPRDQYARFLLGCHGCTVVHVDGSDEEKGFQSPRPHRQSVDSVTMQPTTAASELALVVVFERLPLRLQECIDMHRRKIQSSNAVGLEDPCLVKALTWQILCGLAHLQNRGVLHRDVRPANISVSAEGIVKVGGVSLLSGYRSDSQTKGNSHNTFAGALRYMPPERCKGKQYGHQADSWGVGVIVCQLCLGYHPFSGPAPIFKILTMDVPQLPVLFGSDCRDFVSSALTKNPAKRPQPMEMLKHRWFVGSEVRIHAHEVKSWLIREQLLDTAGSFDLSQGPPTVMRHSVNASEHLADLLSVARVRVLAEADVRAVCGMTSAARWKDGMEAWCGKECHCVTLWDDGTVQLRLAEPLQETVGRQLCSDIGCSDGTMWFPIGGVEPA